MQPGLQPQVARRLATSATAAEVTMQSQVQCKHELCGMYVRSSCHSAQSSLELRGMCVGFNISYRLTPQRVGYSQLWAPLDAQTLTRDDGRTLELESLRL